MTTDAEKATQVAETIADEYGVPADHEQLVARLAYAYAAGNRDGYEEAAGFATEAWQRMTRELLEAASHL